MLYLAIDGGGTKTEGILADEQQTILAHRTVGASNPHDSSLAASVRVLTDLVRELLCDAELDRKGSATGTPTDISLFAGIAGVLSYREDMSAALTASLTALTDTDAFSSVHIAHIGLDSDITILFAAEIPEGDGACVISGTGSVCFLRHGERMERIGGWGYLLDVGGNGYTIGRDALEAVLRAHDGRGEATSLTEHLAGHLGKPVPDALNDIYTGGKTRIASCTPCVFQAAEDGDPVSRAILERNARALAELIQTASARHSIDGAPLLVILGGGLAQKCPAWVSLVSAALPKEVLSSVCLKVASRAPVMGALTLARKQAHS